MEGIPEAARDAVQAAPPVGDPRYGQFAGALAEGLRRRWDDVLAANREDVSAARTAGVGEPVLTDIALGPGALETVRSMADRVRAALPEVTRAGSGRARPGVRARRVPRPIGVVLMVYEARPLVTVDGALIGVCAGNAVVLQGASQIRRTNAALSGVVGAALSAAGLPAGLVQVLHRADRAVLRGLLRRDDAIDLLIPRGGLSLIDYCRSSSRIPVIATGVSVNHIYVHSSAGPEEAAGIVVRSMGVGCAGVETVLVDRSMMAAFAAAFADGLAGAGRRRTVFAPASVMARLPAALGDVADVVELGEDDRSREFPGDAVALRAVGGLDEAIAYVRRYGSGHTEGIVGADRGATESFVRAVDAAAVVVNGPLAWHDGPTLGLTHDVAISSGRLHARGPVTLKDLMTHSWVISKDDADLGEPGDR